MKKIVDCFPFFIEKELLELRVNLLKDHVDKFIITEMNSTHSGEHKDFICKKLIQEFGLPEDKIDVIEIEITEELLNPIKSDFVFANEAESDKVVNWTRERVQRDAMMSALDTYSGDTVFILSDCDEIINPDFLPYFSECCRNNPSSIIKVPLVPLESRADKRLYEGDNPCHWDKSLVLCTKTQLISGGTPTKFRSGFQSPFPPSWIVQDGEVIMDCGWHFTWMGDQDRRNYKAKNVANSANLNVYDNLSSDSLKGFTGGTNNYSLRNYPVELLPQIIFELPRVKEFLLPDEKIKVSFCSKLQPTVWIVDNFYDDPYAIREFALKQTFVEGGFGRGFIGRRTEQQFLWPGLKEAFESIIGQKITEWESHGMNGRFQNAHSGEPLVWHCDSQKWGGMLYLTPDAPYQCGTSLYATKKTRARTYHDPGWDIAWANVPGGCHLDGTHFEPVDVCGNVFNRLFIFDASCIHSASEYFGTVIENSRLWQMFFFDT